MSEGGADGVAAGYRRVDQVLQGVGVSTAESGRDRVADAVFGIDPESRRRLKAAAERNQQILRDVVRREASSWAFVRSILRCR